MSVDTITFKERPIYKILTWGAHHPMIFAAIAIFITSLIGYVYESALFSEFDINIFRFSSVYDFMYQWWRQWAIVSHFFVILFMAIGIILGYSLSALITDNLGKHRKNEGKDSLKEKFISKSTKTPVRNSLVFLLSIFSLIVISFFVVDVNTDVIQGKSLLKAVVLSTLYGSVSFYSLWGIHNFLINNCCVPVWRWTGISLLFIGVMYLFTIMLFNINQLAKTEARLIMGDKKYTYNVVSSNGGTHLNISKDAKILAITTYYHLFYDRETGKVITVSNDYMLSMESNWVR